MLTVSAGKLGYFPRGYCHLNTWLLVRALKKSSNVLQNFENALVYFHGTVLLKSNLCVMT